MMCFSKKSLISKYGLVEAVPFTAATPKVDKPFHMPPPMQVMALFLMGLAGKLSPLEPSFFGFEILTTQLVKCALAAALTIPKRKRPTLKEIFTDKLGFELPVSDKSNASPTVNTWFTDFPNLIPIRPKPLATEFYYTRQHHMAATVYETDEGNVGLLMDEEIGKAAKSFECEAEDSSKFSPPFCSLAYGNSDMNDGYVTFFTQPKDNLEEKATKVTVQNQSKDFCRHRPPSTLARFLNKS
jgi:hypothetical protein